MVGEVVQQELMQMVTWHCSQWQRGGSWGSAHSLLYAAWVPSTLNGTTHI